MQAAECANELDDLIRILNNYQGGVYKRIDEGRELLVLLQDAAPVLLAAFPRIEQWIHKQDDFLMQLSLILEESRGRVKRNYELPRPLPPMKYGHLFFEGPALNTAKLCIERKDEGQYVDD